MNLDDKFGLRQALSQLAVLLLETANLFKERIVLGLGPSPMGDQSLIALHAPVGEVRGVETLAAEHGPDGAEFAGRIGLGQNALLIIGGELAALRPDHHLRVGRRFGFAWCSAPFHLATLGFTPLRTRRSQNGWGRYNAIQLLLHEDFLLRPLQ